MALKLPMSWKWEETRPEKRTICFLIPNSSHKLSWLRLKWTMTFHSSSQTVYEDNFQSPGYFGWHVSSARHRLRSFPPYQVTTDVRLSNRFFHRLHANSAVGHWVDTMALTQTLHVERMEMKWYDKHQTWSNMIKHDMFKTCSSVKHVFTLSVFHSYFVHISFILHIYLVTRPIFHPNYCFPKLQRFAVSPETAAPPR